MSYTKYKTKGIIMGGSNIGEASRSYNIFTRDFGLIRVRAQGIRELNSKLKYHLQNLFLINTHLVKGKSGWRVTEAYKIKSFPESFITKSKLQSSTRILLFLKRMLPEEGENTSLFDIIDKGFSFMEKEDLSSEVVSDLEILMVLRTLRKLGYVKSDKRLETLLSSDDYDNNLLIQTGEMRKFLIREINQSIKTSDL
jgi:DNA repair protein RecO